MTRRLLPVCAAAAAAAALAVTGVTDAAASPVAKTVTTRHTKLGTVLVSGSGRTLYMFASDTARHSTCGSSCASIWPPLTVKAGATVTVGGGARHAKITTIKRGSARQVVYAGHPLYRFVGDTAPGQTSGQGSDGFGAKWWVLRASGAPIK